MISWSPVQLKPAWLTGVPSLGPDSDNSWVVRKSIHIIAPYRDFHAHFSERLSALKSIVDDMTGFLYLLVFIALHKRQDLKQDLWFASFQDASFEACHLAQRSVLSRIKWHLLRCLFPKHVSRRYQGLGSVLCVLCMGNQILGFFGIFGFFSIHLEHHYTCVHAKRMVLLWYWSHILSIGYHFGRTPTWELLCIVSVFWPFWGCSSPHASICQIDPSPVQEGKPRLHPHRASVGDQVPGTCRLLAAWHAPFLSLFSSRRGIWPCRSLLLDNQWWEERPCH